MMHAGQTNQRLTRIPLVTGMQLIITNNFDVEGGIVNGSIGTLENIRYCTDAQGRRHLTSCIVRIPDATADGVPGLSPQCYPILPDTKDVSFTHPYSKKTITIKRTQVPIAPAYAMTAHKAQGQTFTHTIVDLDTCRGSEAPYVMLSRATSLEGVLILRPFQRNRIRCNLNQDLRHELYQRLPYLTLDTMATRGTPAEREYAKTHLLRLHQNVDRYANISSPNLKRAADDALPHASKRLRSDTAILS